MTVMTSAPIIYRTRRDYRAGESVPFALGNQELGPIAVRELLP